LQALSIRVITTGMKKQISFRLDASLVDRLRKASEGMYRPTMTEIVERGIELALREIERKQK
jgi:predicted DNA-binding protein